MCEFNNKNICTINKDVCPWVYWCDKIGDWKALNSMPQDCRIKDMIEPPMGYSKVVMSKGEYIYVLIDEQAIKIKNTFNSIPKYVKVIKGKDGSWRIRK